jgi:isoleucyl-tRNA synthetase
VVGDVVLEPHEFELRLSASVSSADSMAAATLPGSQGIVLLDLTLTDALIAEGVSRDVVRLVQQARRDAGLAVSDRIALTLGLPAEIAAQVASFHDVIAQETLAESVLMSDDSTPNMDLDGIGVFVGVERLR